MKPRFYSRIDFNYILYTTLITSFFAILWGGVAIYNEKTDLLKELVGHGEQLLSSFGTRAINQTIYNEMGIETGSLDLLLEELVANGDFPVTYASFVDHRNISFVHNHSGNYACPNEVPLVTATLKKGTFISEISKGNDGSEACLSIATPLFIGSKYWGSLQIGLSTAEMKKELSAFGRKAVIYSIITNLLMVTAIYVVGRRHAKRLLKLSLALSNTIPQNRELPVSGNHRVIPENRDRDEIGRLHLTYLKMRQRLKLRENEHQMAVESLFLSEKKATVGNLVAGVSHEVNNPLAALSSCIYNLEYMPDSERDENISIAKQAVYRIQKVVGQILDFSRVGNASFTSITSDAFFEEAALFSKMAIKKSGCNLQTHDACAPPIWIVIDKGKINQAILNLVMNAADVSPPQRDVTLKAYNDDDWYYIAITDHGPGISELDAEKIFALFYTTKAPGVGTGMGLTISKNIAEMHRGTIMLDSTPGETTFTIKIPISQELL